MPWTDFHGRAGHGALVVKCAIASLLDYPKLKPVLRNISQSSRPIANVFRASVLNGELTI